MYGKNNHNSVAFQWSKLSKLLRLRTNSLSIHSDKLHKSLETSLITFAPNFARNLLDFLCFSHKNLKHFFR